MLPNMLSPFSKHLRKRQGDRVGWIVKYLNSFDADVVVLQEVFDRQMHRKLRRELRKAYPHQIQPLRRKRWKFWRQNSGVMFLSKSPIGKQGGIIYKIRTAIDRLADKGCTLIKGLKNGKPFQLAGTHLQAGEEHQWVRDSQNLQIAKELLRPQTDLGTPQILVGDLNIPHATLAHQSMLDTLDMQDFPVNDDRPFTSDSINYWNPGQKPQKIDYILLKPNGSGAKVIEQRIIRPHLFENNRRIDYSDHFGVFSIIKL